MTTLTLHFVIPVHMLVGSKTVLLLHHLPVVGGLVAAVEELAGQIAAVHQTAAAALVADQRAVQVVD